MLDTDVISELRKPRPDANVLNFLKGVPPGSLYLSSLSLGELRKGISLRSKSDKPAAQALAAWVDGLEAAYANCILPVDKYIARVWGELSAAGSRPIIDTLLAATALYYDLILATRNIMDVQDTPVRLLNPWTPL